MQALNKNGKKIALAFIWSAGCSFTDKAKGVTVEVDKFYTQNGCFVYEMDGGATYIPMKSVDALTVSSAGCSIPAGAPIAANEID